MLKSKMNILFTRHILKCLHQVIDESHHIGLTKFQKHLPFV